MTSEGRQSLGVGLGVLPWKNLRPRSSNWLKTKVILFPSTDLHTLRVEICVRINPSLKKQKMVYPKATVQLIASFFGVRQVCKLANTPRGLPVLTKGRT